MKKKIGRNDPCWCGSRKKYKNCHADEDQVKQRSTQSSLDPILGEFGAKSMQQTLASLPSDPADALSQMQKVADAAKRIAEEKRLGKRSRPSQHVLLGRSRLSTQVRLALLDLIASIVDENEFGRAEMCVLFAILLKDALNHVGSNAEAIVGKATYFNEQDKSKHFTWDHAWVLTDGELVDGNIDSMPDNPMIPANLGLQPLSFWGSLSEFPSDRHFEQEKVVNDEWERLNTDTTELSVFRKHLFAELPKIMESGNGS